MCVSCCACSPFCPSFLDFNYMWTSTHMIRFTSCAIEKETTRWCVCTGPPVCNIHPSLTLSPIWTCCASTHVDSWIHLTRATLQEAHQNEPMVVFTSLVYVSILPEPCHVMSKLLVVFCIYPAPVFRNKMADRLRTDNAKAVSSYPMVKTSAGKVCTTIYVTRTVQMRAIKHTDTCCAERTLAFSSDGTTYVDGTYREAILITRDPSRDST